MPIKCGRNFNNLLEKELSKEKKIMKQFMIYLLKAVVILIIFQKKNCLKKIKIMKISRICL